MRNAYTGMYIMNINVLAHNFDRLRHFLWVYEAGSFLGASRVRGIGQPQLSRSIKALEQELDVRLFDRSSTGLTPTAHALMLYDVGLNVLSQLNEFERRISDNRNTALKGKITLGTYSSISRYLLPRFFDFFDVLHPELDLALELGRSQEIKERVGQGKIDIGIVVGRENIESLHSSLLYEDEYSFYQASGLKPGRKDQLILYEGALSKFQDLKKAIKSSSPKLIKVDSYELAYQLACEGLGLALLPNRVAGQGVDSQVLVKTIWCNMPLSFNRHQVYLVHKKRTQAIIDFQLSLREFLELYF
tara:strand:- start:47 stop:955 length:909 start_codon:yes stop_codon:yes gene_type:complete